MRVGSRRKMACNPVFARLTPTNTLGDCGQCSMQDMLVFIPVDAGVSSKDVECLPPGSLERLLSQAGCTPPMSSHQFCHAPAQALEESYFCHGRGPRFSAALKTDWPGNP